MTRALPTDSAERKNYPLFRGFLRYFPAAIAGAARISKLGNDKHNPGEEMHHARGKSSDHGDCIMRHLHDADEMIAAFERLNADRDATFQDTKKLLDEVDQLFWRAGAFSQEVHERYGNAPLAAGARLPNADIKGLSPEIYRPSMRSVEGVETFKYPLGGEIKGGPAQVDADGGAVRTCTSQTWIPSLKVNAKCDLPFGHDGPHNI